jgi:pimeloyl-ACP methyl ester carboxylesterase
MRGVSCVDWIAAVDAAYLDARVLGQEVVVIGSSLGGSLALLLASHQAVAALVLWSPGIAPAEPALLDQFCAAGDQVIRDPRERTPAQQRWNRAAVHADGFRAMRDLFEGSMHRHTFARVTAPTWLGFYYRDEAQQDPTASVSAMRTMFEQLGTPAGQRQAVAFADAAHNLASTDRSPAAVDVLAQSQAFLRDRLERVVPAT